MVESIYLNFLSVCKRVNSFWVVLLERNTHTHKEKGGGSEKNRVCKGTKKNKKKKKKNLIN